MKKLKTFADCCVKIGKNPKGRYSASQKVDIITAAIVGKWKADFSNSNQYKYIPWFVWDQASSAFVFLNSYYTSSYSLAGSGVRLRFETREQSDYAGKTFTKEYNDELTGE